jgi:hypothetical protein
MTPCVITKATGHVETARRASDLRYLDETESRGRWGFRELSAEEIKDLVGKNRRIFIAADGGKIERLPAEVRSDRKRTGTISEAYAAQLEEMQREGKNIYERVVLGRMELKDDHGFALARERGAVVPLTWAARVEAQELGWDESLSAEAGRPILSRLMRDSIHSHRLTRRAVKTMTGEEKTGKTIAAHNLVVAPHPRLLERIRRAGQPVDAALETAARRAVEKMERSIGAKITAVASTHLQDSSGVRPHLHVRMVSHDSEGKYIALFNRKGGGSGGGRCLLQPEVERQIEKIIERWEPRGRN